MTRLQTLGAVVSVALAGAAVGLGAAAAIIHDRPAPDWTVAPCTMTHAPAYTVPGWCVDGSGTLQHR